MRWVPAAVMAVCAISLGAAGPKIGAEDETQDYLRTPNFPESDQAPVEAVPVLPDGLALAPGAVSKAAMVFTPRGSTGSRSKLDAQVYYNPIFGNQTTVTGNDGIEGDTSSNFTRVRRYREGSRFDLLHFMPDGLNLGSICADNNAPSGCTPGRVYGAMIRLPTVIVPGDIVSLTMRTGNSPFFYIGAALYAAVQTTPGPGRDPYNGTGALHYGACYGEIDLDDDYAVAGVPVGHQLKMGALAEGSYAQNAGGQCYRHAPRQVYDAQGTHFRTHANGGHPYSEILGRPSFEGMHNYTLWLTGDGSHLVHYFYDGMLVSTQYYEPALSTYPGPAGRPVPVGYSLVIAAQTIPNFLNAAHDPGAPPYTHIMPNDGGPIAGGAWSATIASIRIVHGALTASALAASRVDPNGTDGQAYGGLHDLPGP